MKRMSMILMACLMVLGMSQCKKENQNASTEPEGVKITLTVDNGGERVAVTPGETVTTVTFEDGDVILVADDQHYLGSLSRTNGAFTGTVTQPGTDHLHFFFAGNKVAPSSLTPGTSTGCTVDMSDQSDGPAVVSYASMAYDGSSSVTASVKLLNKASGLVKFTTNIGTTNDITIAGVYNKMNITFGAEPTIATDQTERGTIKLNRYTGDNDNKTFLAVIPVQNAVNGASVTVTGFTADNIDIPPVTESMNGAMSITLTATSFDPLTTPLTFEAKEAGAMVTLSIPSQIGVVIEYSTDDGSTWHTETYPEITLEQAGDKVMFRATSSNTQLCRWISSTGSPQAQAYPCRFSIKYQDCYVYGNVMSLLYKDFSDKTSFPSGSEYTFYSLFYSCARLCNHPDKAIVLPATTMVGHCHEEMFKSCTRLTTVPELPATTLAYDCYHSMFTSCTSLTTVPSNLLPVTELAGRCYLNMFRDCSALTTAPDLPAPTLATNCYQYMFYNCTNLTSVNCQATANITYDNVRDWLYGITTPGTLHVAGGTTSAWTDSGTVPSSWTISDQ